MNVEINWIAVVLATLSTMVVGSIWYARPVFGNIWMKLIGKTPKDLQKNGMVKPIVITVIVSFLTAYILAHVSFLSNQYFHNSFFQDSVTTAFWLWLGLVAARFITHDVFEGRPAKLTVLNLSHELVTLLVMGMIIGWLHP
jgi:hypothetical protein